jgi:hypothetical protein
MWEKDNPKYMECYEIERRYIFPNEYKENSTSDIKYTTIKPLYMLSPTLEISYYIYSITGIYAHVNIAVMPIDRPPKIHEWNRDGNRWISVGIEWIKKKATPQMIAGLIAWRMTKNEERQLPCRP